jgi:formylglycine-generating enzyme required for sulfatase activity
MKTQLHSPAAALFAVLALSLLAAASLPAAEGISNLRVSQRAGTNLVDLHYDLSTIATNPMFVAVAVSTNGGNSYDLPASHFTGDVGFGPTAGTNKWIVWEAFRDWPDQFSTNVFFRLTASDTDTPPGMALIPAGSFTMGNCMDSSEGWSDELPLHTVYVSAFYMDKYDVTKALWDDVYNWAITNGYGFEYGALGKAADHPVQMIDWYDCVKWCNARSEKEGRVPAYYADAELSVPYRSGRVAPYANWGVGYRLPTEAEWEKAARGGASGQRFPWGNTISWSEANYYAYPLSADPVYGYAYDMNATEGYHPTFATGDEPYTSPVGYFAANGYGLYDMAGNMEQWCWDWYGSYSSDLQIDPRGPASGSYHVLRSGSWYFDASLCRAAYRDYFNPTGRFDDVGFRCVLSPGQ